LKLSIETLAGFRASKASPSEEIVSMLWLHV
jgi:hypothetical protein